MASRLHGLSVCFLLSVVSRGFAQPPPSIRIDTGAADAVLRVLSGRGKLSNIGETEGYTRLKSREAAMGRAFSEDECAQFLDSEGLRLRKKGMAILGLAIANGFAPWCAAMVALGLGHGIGAPDPTSRESAMSLIRLCEVPRLVSIAFCATATTRQERFSRAF